ncbi:hypothetical protein HOLleu_02450 [Holothuria leucospilota]|uniref:Uncharacterized protein n=1 Tax=Holothuria leucospilota TaxID=206669 RepID=A0A9Q1CQP6_HOLLE|nr:hypothetical protein HOLleu_02450 [Holothuria leucospilota]
MEEFNTFVDIDEEEDCDYLLEAKHILVQTSQYTAVGLPSSPSLPDTSIILDSSIEEDHAFVTSSASSSQSSLGEVGEGTNKKSESGGTTSKNIHDTDIDEEFELIFGDVNNKLISTGIVRGILQ